MAVKLIGMDKERSLTPAQGPESSFLATLLDRLTTTICFLKSESLLRLHEMLDCPAEPQNAPPGEPHWQETVELVEGELARRGIAVRPIRRPGGSLVAVG